MYTSSLTVTDNRADLVPSTQLLLKEPTDEIGTSAAQDPLEDGKDFFFRSFSPNRNDAEEILGASTLLMS